MGLLLPDGRCGRRHGAACAIGGVGPTGAGLTNTIALWLGLILLAGIIADFAFNGGSALMFLARKFLDLIEWVDFWN
jgi:hypothetical protein